MNDLILNSSTPADLTQVPSDELRQALHDAIGLTAHAIARVATIWNELTRRGEDLSGVKFALRDYMVSVATGRLLPEAVALLAGRLRTLNAVAELPLEEQRRLVSGDPVSVVQPDGAIANRTLDEMTWVEVSRVFRDGIIRTPAEQRLVLAHQESAIKRRGRPRGRPPRLAVDPENGAFRVGTVSVPLERVLATLRAAGYDLREK